MPRRRSQITPPNPNDYIQCPLDLDAIIMSPTITPDVLELNCSLVDDNILFDAIRLSTCAYWLFKLDILEQFGLPFRHRLFTCTPGMSRITRMYFNYQIEASRNKELLADYKRFLSEIGLFGSDPLNNPLTMLGNNVKDADLTVLQGGLPPRQMLLNQIQGFLETKDKSKIDFSYSLFLPEFLHPKFFQGLSEAEHIVIVGNLSKYFEFLTKFTKVGLGLRGTWKSGKELNPPQLLIKHILADEKGIYTNRVKMMSWNQLCNEQDKLASTGGIYKLFDTKKIERNWNELYEKLDKKELSTLKVDEWLKTAEGVFESFELDCTLHNVDATDFLLQIMIDKGNYKMARGLMEFQDSETRNKLFKVISDAMTPFR